MAARAFIIAIEDYPQSASLARRLQQTTLDAESFRQWLINKKKVDPADIYSCAGPTAIWTTAGTDRDAIVKELKRLIDVGKDRTEELYFYFSGHGFLYSDSPWEWQMDVIVASDFVDLDNSGNCCLKLQEIQLRLSTSLGPGDHYYFVDACRTSVKTEDIQVSGLGKKFPASVLGKPTIYTLFSTAMGLPAKVSSGFSKFVVQGLSGQGRAKRWDGNRMVVTFEQLCEYVKAKIGQQEIDSAKRGPGSGFIWEVVPIPDSVCDVVVDNADPQDSFMLTVTNALGTAANHQFQGNSCRLALKPYDYSLQVTHPQSPVVQVNPPPSGPLDLYEPCEVHFKKDPAGQAQSPMASVELEGAPGLEIHLEHLNTGTVFKSDGILSRSVMPGAYQVKIREGGITVEKRTLRLEPDKLLKLNLLDRTKGRIRDGILGAVPEIDKGGKVYFSETLGGMANWDLCLWLSIMGASQISAAHGSFSKLSRLPLTAFPSIGRNESAIYVLAGFEKLEGELKIAVSTGAAVQWEPLRYVDGLAGIHEFLRTGPEGACLISFKIPDRASITFASYCLPNRVTFLVLTEDENSRFKMHQYLLPIYSSLQHMEPEAAELAAYYMHQPLRVIRAMSLAQTQFARNLPLQDTWQWLIYQKWLDPIMCLIAAYEIFRRGDIKPDTTRLLAEMVRNLRKHFHGLPDTEVLATILAQPSFWGPQAVRDLVQMQSALDYPPLLMEGLLMLGEDQTELPLPWDNLDYNNPWTSWLGAVAKAEVNLQAHMLA